MWSLKVNRRFPSRKRYRYIVIGAGTSGSLLANRLATATEHQSVLLLEAGSATQTSYLNPWFHIPVGYLKAQANPAMDWCMATEPDPGIGGRSLNYTRGKTLGGCSSINGMIVNRGQRRDYDRWAQITGNTDWNWDRSLPLFRKFESHWSKQGGAPTRAEQENSSSSSSNNNGATPSDSSVANAAAAAASSSSSSSSSSKAVMRTSNVVGFSTARSEHELNRESITHVLRGKPRDENEIFDPTPNELHGADGEMPVSRPRFEFPILHRVREAFERFGVPVTDDLNSGDWGTGRCGFFDVNQKRGMRCSAADAFIAPILGKRNNFECVAGSTVLRLRFEKEGIRQRCIGLTAVTNGRVTYDVDLDWGGEVILCAGAVHSPAILQVSGIGPRDVLNVLGVDKVRELPVGRGMEDHLQIRPVFKIGDEHARRMRGILSPYRYSARGITLNTISRSPFGVARIALDYALRQSGPASLAPSQFGAFVRTSETDAAAPFLQWHVQPLSLPAFGKPLDPFEGITMSVANLNPTSRGRVSARSPRLDSGPAAIQIETNYLSTERDREIAQISVEYTRALMAQDCMKDLGLEEVRPGAGVIDPIELGKISTTIFHPCCTCKMGPIDDKDTVVDSKLRVLGVDGLRVADCSVMPAITSGNTNTPALMIAERAATYIIEDIDRLK